MDFDKDYNEVMDLLLTVPGVKEYLESDEVKVFKKKSFDEVLRND